MKVELYADSENKKDTRLIVNDKEIDLRKCTTLIIDIAVNNTNFIKISSVGGTVWEQLHTEK